MSKRRYIVNDGFFKTWSSDMAYILGLWWADGHIDDKRKTFAITQKKDEYQLLADVKNAMSSNNPIKTYKNITILRITSEEIVKDIQKHCSGKYTKDKRVKLPNIPDEYVKDFIRGFFDGDGGICSFKYKRRPLFYRSYITGADLFFLQEIKDVLAENVGVKGSVYKRTQNIGDVVNRCV
jgi:intein-encoded DNA endonuclease-like protein